MNKTVRITISGNDCTDYIHTIPQLPQRKSEVGQLLEIPLLYLTCDNTEHLWTPGHSNSILDHTWFGEPIHLYREDELLFEGELSNIQWSNFGQTAELEVSAKINRLLTIQVMSFQASTKTFAELSQEIYQQFGIPTDQASYAMSQQHQETYAFQARAQLFFGMNGTRGMQSSQQTLLQVQQFLANAGLCRHYFLGNTAYMEFESPNPPAYPVYVFTDKELLQCNDFHLLQQEPWDGYEVHTAMGTASKLGTHMPPVLNVDADQPFCVDSLEMGYNWGDIMLEYAQHERYFLSALLADDSPAAWLTLQSIIQIEFERTGIHGLFQLVGLDDSPTLGTLIYAESIPTVV